jgi:hypothetical protein
MFDDPDALAGSDRRHYVECAYCQARYSGMAEDARTVATLLAAPDLQLDVTSALKRVEAAPAAKPRFGFSLPILSPAARPMFVAVGAAAILVALVVTAFADILPLFQPKTVEAVPVSFADIQSLSALSDYGTLTWTVKPTPQVVLSAADAQNVAQGMHAPATTYLPSTVTPAITFAAMPKAEAVFTFDAAKAADAAAKTGKTLPTLPAGVDGAQLTVKVGPAIVEVFGNLKPSASASSNNINLPQLVIARSGAPVVTSTQVSTATLENYILSLPGISPDLANAVRAIKDPSTTLLIPVPVQYATSTKVKINVGNGKTVDGVALGDNTGLGSAVIWIDGDVFVVAGSVTQTDVVKIADGLTV